LPYLKKKEVLSRLRLKMRFLEKVKKWLFDHLQEEKEFSSHQRLLLKHHLNLLSAEEDFVNEIIKIVKGY
jgi:hypothetical protein